MLAAMGSVAATPILSVPEQNLTGSPIIDQVSEIEIQDKHVSPEVVPSAPNYELAGTTFEGPPGFPFPVFRKIQNDNTQVWPLQILPYVADPVFQKMVLPVISEEQAMGKEGIAIWNEHFAPSSKSEKVILVPIERAKLHLCCSSFPW